jgi:hypothetical protein
MRIILFMAIMLPALVRGQINRSATELAKENIRSYVTRKLFKAEPYQPISFGELKPQKERNADTRWSIVHKFNITEIKGQADKKLSVQEPYDFIFYLDDRMEVIGARSYMASE